MSIYGWIYIGIIGVSVLCAITFILYKSIKEYQIQQECFNKEVLQEYEMMLSKFRQTYNILETDEISTIVQKANFQIVEYDRKEMPKGYDGKMNGREIRIARDLNSRQKNAIVAHEMAHYLKNNEPQIECGCKSKTIRVRPKDEQICDYIASMILLPENELKKELETSNYKTLSSNKRTQFVANLADKRNISTLIVAKRIADVSDIK